MIRTTFLALLMIASQASAWCVEPVEDARKGTDPLDWRDFQLHRVIPGYPYLLISPAGYGLRTIIDGRFVDLETEFPHGGLGGTTDWVVLDDGRVWGWRFADGGKQLYEFRPGQDGFVRAGVSGFINQEFDPYQQVMLLLFKDKGLMQWDGSTLAKAPFGETPFGRDSELPTFQPALGIYLARPGKKIYAIDPKTPTDWQEVNFGWWSGPPAYFTFFWSRTMQIADDGKVATLHTGKHLYVLNRTGAASLDMIYRLDGYHKVVKDDAGNLWSQPTLLTQQAIALTARKAIYQTALSLPEGHPARPATDEFNKHISTVFEGTFVVPRDKHMVFRPDSGGEEPVEPLKEAGNRTRYFGDVPGENYGLVRDRDELLLLHRYCPIAK